MSNPMLIEQLKEIVGSGHCIQGDDLLQRNMVWGEQQPCCALVLIRPANTEELSASLKLCHDSNQPVMIAGGLTNLVNATIAKSDEIVISLERMNQIIDLNSTELTITLEAGVLLQNAQQAAAGKMLQFPWDIGARGSCMIGGNIATNAGGTKVIRNGMARDSVLGLEVVMADGRIMSSMTPYVKNNSGYDLKQLFVGTEGTLGVITKAIIKLLSLPNSRNVGLFALSSYDRVLELFATVTKDLGNNFSAFEVMWNQFYRLATASEYRIGSPLPKDYPFYVLVESSGLDIEQDQLHLEQSAAQWFETRIVADGALSQSESDCLHFWSIRDNVHCLYDKGTALTFDISLPIADIKTFVDFLNEHVLVHFQHHSCVPFGHLGDNNLHLAINIDGHESQQQALKKAVYQSVQKFNGAISAEHGIGEEKRDYLTYCRSDTEIELMYNLKQLFDSKTILNRNRVIAYPH